MNILIRMPIDIQKFIEATKIENFCSICYWMQEYVISECHFKSIFCMWWFLAKIYWNIQLHWTNKWKFYPIHRMNVAFHWTENSFEMFESKVLILLDKYTMYSSQWMHVTCIADQFKVTSKYSLFTTKSTSTLTSHASRALNMTNFCIDCGQVF